MQDSAGLAAAGHQVAHPPAVCCQVVVEVAALDHGEVEHIVKVAGNRRYRRGVRQVRRDNSGAQGLNGVPVGWLAEAGQGVDVGYLCEMFHHGQRDLPRGAGDQYPCAAHVNGIDGHGSSLLWSQAKRIVYWKMTVLNSP